MPLDIDKISSPGLFRFKKTTKSEYLLTNEVGDYSFLAEVEFNALLDKNYSALPKNKEDFLRRKGFIGDNNDIDFNYYCSKYASRMRYIATGTSLHIVVVTLKCNHSCVYCQAKAKRAESSGYDMGIDIAKKTVDAILTSPNHNINIEFQGGEPLVNFDTVKYIIDYAKKANREGKKVSFSLVTNLELMNDSILTYLTDNKVNVSTSLDGPRQLHDRNRVSLRNKSSYDATVKWIHKSRSSKQDVNFPSIGALATITKHSFAFSKAIVDEYIALGLRDIHLRPVTPFALTKSMWGKIGFNAEQFINFYRKTVDYIIFCNRKGDYIRERFAAIFLAKILTDSDPDFLDIRSPCGAAIGQLAYHYNGDVFTCDEGRMMFENGDDSFRIGNVNNFHNNDISNSPVVKTMAVASCLDNLPQCCECVYKPYCGVCPVYNHFTQGNVFTRNKFLCKINFGILDYIFEKLKDKETRDVFCKWVTPTRGGGNGV